MKNITGYVILCSVTAVFVAILCSALSISSLRNSSIVCSQVRIVVKDSLESRFVSCSDVLGYLKAGYGNCVGDTLNQINLKTIEDIIDSKSAVLKSEAFVTKDGTLNVEVVQRKPMIRFQSREGGFYSDAQGYLFPLKANHASHVIVVDGELPLKISAGYKGQGNDKREQKWISDIVDLVNYMEKSGVWAENIVQINVRKNGDLVLVPREGHEVFIFGKPDRVAEKFGLMAQYYKTILPLKGENHYSSVDLRYEGQIICK